MWTFGLLKEAVTLDIASPDTCQYLNPPFEPFICNQPRVSRPRFRLETNSTVVWLYAGGVSLILPDVRFGIVSRLSHICKLVLEAFVVFQTNLCITMMQYKHIVLMPKSPVIMAIIVFQLIGFNFMITFTAPQGLDSLLLIVHTLKVTTIILILKLDSLL